MPTHSAIFFSSCFVLGPVVIQPDLIADVTSAISGRSDKSLSRHQGPGENALPKHCHGAVPGLHPGTGNEFPGEFGKLRKPSSLIQVQ